MSLKLVFLSEDYSKHFEILNNDKVIGNVSIREIDNNSVCIESIDFLIEYRKKGFGANLILDLLSRYEYIIGCANPLSIGFWKKVGAEFEYPVSEDIIDELMDIGEYPPFKIKLNHYVKSLYLAYI